MSKPKSTFLVNELSIQPSGAYLYFKDDLLYIDPDHTYSNLFTTGAKKTKDGFVYTELSVPTMEDYAILPVEYDSYNEYIQTAFEAYNIHGINKSPTFYSQEYGIRIAQARSLLDFDGNIHVNPNQWRYVQGTIHINQQSRGRSFIPISELYAFVERPKLYALSKEHINYDTAHLVIMPDKLVICKGGVTAKHFNTQKGVSF